MFYAAPSSFLPPRMFTFYTLKKLYWWLIRPICLDHSPNCFVISAVRAYDFDSWLLNILVYGSRIDNLDRRRRLHLLFSLSLFLVLRSLCKATARAYQYSMLLIILSILKTIFTVWTKLQFSNIPLTNIKLIIIKMNVSSKKPIVHYVTDCLILVLYCSFSRFPEWFFWWLYASTTIIFF